MALNPTFAAYISNIETLSLFFKATKQINKVYIKCISPNLNTLLLYFKTRYVNLIAYSVDTCTTVKKASNAKWPINTH